MNVEAIDFYKFNLNFALRAFLLSSPCVASHRIYAAVVKHIIKPGPNRKFFIVSASRRTNDDRAGKNSRFFH